MTKLFCDFCGDEVGPTDRRAVLVLLEPEGRTENPFEALLGRGAAESRQLEMCRACVGHLLAVSSRVKEGRTPRRRTSGTIAEETLRITE